MTDEIRQLTGMEWIALHTACQVLSMPSGFFGRNARHKHAKAAILKVLGYLPKGKPPRLTDIRATGRDTREVYLEWLGLEAVEP